MGTTTRDPWADAHRIAAKDELDPELAAVRRRLRVRRALGLALGLAVLLGVVWTVDFILDPDGDEVWDLRLRTLYATFGLMGLGLVLMIIGAVRTSGAARPFVASDAFLSRGDRTWLRRQVTEGRSVLEDRRAVVTDAAQAMVVEGRYVPTYLGLTVLYLGMILGGMRWGSLIMFSAVVAWMLVRAVRAVVRSRRARRWLALNA
ncbi:hypothetical protein [Microlunatus antarcticus]|uniref:Uncharacterized protein n=1 Tax=Microlunatus antarcticus TaxID=53388 RepID=A0A7W5JS07_9ACTN|nr:hypothetical protein [Microlunatus antarcticus]MBB3325128.1 hypothetical protein [Microlunatus antarcticus]